MEKKILLIADDDEMSRKVIHRFVSDTYEVLEAVDGEEALNIMKTQHVDALLLDIVMPKIDGLEVLKVLRGSDNFCNVGILVATATKEKTERTALSLGADDVVSKPYDPIVIRKRLENIILVKQVRLEKELLKDQNVESIQEHIRKNIAKEAIEPVKRIASIAQIIRMNKDNTMLIEEMADILDSAGKALMEMFENKND